MSTSRLTARAPSVRPIATARLYHHRLRFHKIGHDGSGKCDAEYTNNESDIIYGVVLEISIMEKRRLDKIEGAGNGYDEKSVSVFTQDGKTFEVLTYYAINIDSSLAPYH